MTVEEMMNKIEEIDMVRNELKEKIEGISLNIEKYKMELEIGESTSERIHRAKYAKMKTEAEYRRLGAERNALNIKISKIRREENSKTQKTLERYFINAAQEILDRETYLSIWDRAELMKRLDDIK